MKKTEHLKMKDLNELTIANATTADISEIRRLAFAIWPLAYGEILSEAQIAYMLDLFYEEEAMRKQFQTQHFLLARLGIKNVGFASFSNSEENTHARLHKLYVMPGMQGIGLGRKLLNAVVAEAEALQMKAVELNVNRQNKAIAFYEKYGFTTIREEDISIGNDYWMNDYVMRFNIQ